MSFYTSLIWHRPGPVPPITGTELARLVRQLLAGEALVPDGEGGVEFLTVEGAGGVAAAVDAEEEAPAWEVTVPFAALSEIIERLEAESRPLHRAVVYLGELLPPVTASIARVGSPDQDEDFVPDAVSFRVGPVLAASLADETPVPAGGLGLSISGYGYLYPWTLQDAVDRCEASRPIRAMMEACAAWCPASTEPDDATSVLAVRRDRPELWSYDPVSPLAWGWCVEETG